MSGRGEDPFLIVGTADASWQVLQPSSEHGSSSDGGPRGSSSDGGVERASIETEVSRTLDEKSCASSWEFVPKNSSGPSSSKSPSCGGSGSGTSPDSPTRCKDKVPRHGSGNGLGSCGGSEASVDMPGEDFAGEAGVDSPGTCDWYPQDSMEIDAMLAQELGLLVTGPELRSIQFPPSNAVHSTSELGPSEGLDCFKAYEASRPSVCEQAYSMLQSPLRLLGVAQAVAPVIELQGSACPQEVLSLKTFLDEDIPKFPFACSPHSAATWTRVTA
jgi:hypothetical protein